MQQHTMDKGHIVNDGLGYQNKRFGEKYPDIEKEKPPKWRFAWHSLPRMVVCLASAVRSTAMLHTTVTHRYSYTVLR